MSGHGPSVITSKVLVSFSEIDEVAHDVNDDPTLDCGASYKQIASNEEVAVPLLERVADEIDYVIKGCIGESCLFEATEDDDNLSYNDLSYDDCSMSAGLEDKNERNEMRSNGSSSLVTMAVTSHLGGW